ncbi:MAG TPA: hypothetical protein VFB99_24725, partial [Vicinamibacterales bacterium]|nr:hypothetical protein [Vicinamibacterales bacterium]
TRWERREVGAILGLSVCDGKPIPVLSLALSEAEAARKEADLRPDQKLALLKKWRAALDQLQRTEEAIDRLHRSLRDFATDSNVALMCHLVKNEDRQREIVTLLLKRKGESTGPTHVASVWNAIRQSVRKQNGDRNFRVAY